MLSNFCIICDFFPHPVRCPVILSSKFILYQHPVHVLQCVMYDLNLAKEENVQLLIIIIISINKLGDVGI